MVLQTRFYGQPAATFEIEDDPKLQNILDPLGFCFLLSMCFRLVPRVPCSYSHDWYAISVGLFGPLNSNHANVGSKCLIRVSVRKDVYAFIVLYQVTDCMNPLAYPRQDCSGSHQYARAGCGWIGALLKLRVPSMHLYWLIKLVMTNGGTVEYE